MNTLIYDSRCNLCKTLALKIWKASSPEIELRALTDPKAQKILDRTYPGGWKFDFYLVDDAGVHRGWWALNRIRRLVGTATFSSLVAEFAQVKTSTRRNTLAHDHAVTPSTDGKKPSVSRRRLLEGVALGAVLAPLSALAKAQPAFAEANPKYVVTYATSVPSGTTDRVSLERADITTASKSVLQGGSSTKPKGTLTRKPETVHVETKTVSGGDVRVIEYDMIRQNPDDADRAQHVVSGSLDGGRYIITINIGSGDVTKTSGRGSAGTLSVKVDHDLAQPVADMITVPIQSTDVKRYLYAYQSAIKQLISMHLKEGRSDLAALYSEILEDFKKLVLEVIKVIPTVALVIEKNAMVITATMGILKFTKQPDSFNSTVLSAGCSCSCDCGCCCDCGVGCGCGLCGCDCGPGCCCECGCGCSCGCCA